ncbi:MAG: SIS domain-containing protein [Rhodothermales bacterium]|nr:SIS domain-containing protein [Rhodothermales bacterium]
MPVRSVIAEHLRVIELLVHQADEIERIGRDLAERVKRGGRVFWMGNGGSAAQSMHFAAELVGRFKRERQALASLAFSADPSVVTAIGNDYGFEQIFARQVRAWCRTGDVLIGLSTSGRSPNVIAAFEEASSRNVYTLGLTGRSGGEMADAVDACLMIPSDDTARIQEAHLLVGHMWCDWIEQGALDAGPAS